MTFFLLLFGIVNRTYSLTIINMKSTASYIGFKERQKASREMSPNVPSTLTRCSTTGTQSLPPPELPRLVAEQHVPISANDRDSQRLIVVLSNASLETYRAAHGGRTGGAREEKYSLLNSDEHIGVMRKMNRDISDARPDITHQVLSPYAQDKCRSWMSYH